MYITRIYFPVMNLDNGDFSYDKEISTEELIRLQEEQFRRTDANVDRYVHGYGRSGGGSGMFELSERKAVLDETNSIPFECNVQGVNDNIIIDSAFFENKLNDGKMFILRMNINPTVIDIDGESELRFWLDDSKKLLEDRTLDNNTKLKHLPKRDIGIDVEKNKYMLRGCKIIERRCSDKFPYYFAVIVEKIDK